jgi:hypothetical protein
VNCSTADLYCAKAEIVQIALPRRCSQLQQGRWSTGAVTTTLLGRYQEPLSPHRRGTGEILFVGNPDRPYVVYEYRPGYGVETILYDSEKKINLVGLAVRGELSEFKRRLQRSPGGNPYDHTLYTFDPFARCEESVKERR